MEEVIELYRCKLIEKINQYDKILQSMVDDYNESQYQEILEEKRMILYCLDLLSESEREVYNKERNDK